MRKGNSVVAALLLTAAVAVPAMADTTPQSLPFAQNWTGTDAALSAPDNWSGVPGFTGFLGDDGSTTSSPYAGGDPQTIVTVFGAVDLANDQTPAFTSGGVAEMDGLVDPTVAMQGSGTADAPYLIAYINTTGWTNIQVSYNLRDVDGTDNSIQPVALQYRVGNAGNFTNIPLAYVADASASGATTVTPVSVTLPGAADNVAEVQVRWITINAASNDEWIGIDDISITGTVVPVEVSEFTID